MGTLTDLAARMTALKASLAQQASLCAVQAALAITTDLAYVTPVDTSNALSNWQTSLDNPIEVEITPYYPGVRGSTQALSAQETITVAEQKLKKKQPGQTIYISNNAPYIIDLNNGSSKQTPAGFVERSTLLGSLVVKNFKMNLG